MAMSIGPTAGYLSTPAAAPAPAPAATPSAAPTVARDRLTLVGQELKGTVQAAMNGNDVAGAPAFEVKAVGAVHAVQNTLAGWVTRLHPLRQPGIQATAAPQTWLEKAKAVGKAAVFFALPVGGAAAVACGLGWLVGPLVPIVGGHVFGAVLGSLAVGETAGFLLHGVMRMPLVTDPAQREINSAGVTVGSAALGVGFAAAIAMAAGAPITLPILALGALAGAGPRLVEWGLARL